MSTGYANVLGVKINAVNIPMALETIDTWIKSDEQNYVTVTGVHGVIESQRDAELRAIHNRAGMVVPDGMPMVWANHLQMMEEMKKMEKFRATNSPRLRR